MPLRDLVGTMIVVLALVAAACGGGDGAGESTSGQTPGANSSLDLTPAYNELDLASAESGLTAVLDAWNNRDAVRLMELLDRDAQAEAWRTVGQLDLGTVLVHNDVPLPSFEDFDQVLVSFLFAEFLWAGAEGGALRADLTDASIIGSLGPSVAASGRAAEDLRVGLAEGGELIVRMAQSPSGKWRLLRVFVNGDVAAPRADGLYAFDACTEDPRITLVAGASCEDLDAVIESDTVGGPDVEVRNLCAVLQGHAVQTGIPDGVDLAAVGGELSQRVCPGDPSALGAYEWPRPGIARQSISASSFYGRLDLATPDAAVATFRGLVEEERFFELLVATAKDAQQRTTRELVRGELDRFSATAAEQFETGPQGFADLEHDATVGPAMFEAVMRAGAAAADLTIDVRGSVVEGEPEPIAGFGDGALLLRAAAPGHPEGLGFVVVQAPSGRWRVRQVAAPAEAIDPDVGLFVAAS